jgi:hypothetical protein
MESSRNRTGSDNAVKTEANSSASRSLRGIQRAVPQQTLETALAFTFFDVIACRLNIDIDNNRYLNASLY